MARPAERARARERGYALGDVARRVKRQELLYCVSHRELQCINHRQFWEASLGQTLATVRRASGRPGLPTADSRANPSRRSREATHSKAARASRWRNEFCLCPYLFRRRRRRRRFRHKGKSAQPKLDMTSEREGASCKSFLAR